MSKQIGFVKNILIQVANFTKVPHFIGRLLFNQIYVRLETYGIWFLEWTSDLSNMASCPILWKNRDWSVFSPKNKPKKWLEIAGKRKKKSK